MATGTANLAVVTATTDLRFRPLTRSDLPLVVRWQHSEAARPWFGGGLSLEQAIERYGPRIDGVDPVRMYVALLGGRPVGYAQEYAAPPPPVPAGAAPPGEPVGIDYLLGEDELVDHGVGTALIGAFIDRVVRRDHPSATHVVARPDHRNRRSIRALEKNGFVAGLWVDSVARLGEPPITEIVCTLATLTA